jgi:hypothetical protein
VLLGRYLFLYVVVVWGILSRRTRKRFKLRLATRADDGVGCVLLVLFGPCPKCRDRSRYKFVAFPARPSKAGLIDRYL